MNNYYYTHSLNMAAWLKSKGFDLKCVDRINGTATFYFDNSDEVHNAVREYNTKDELKKFINAFREIRQYVKN